MKVSTVRVKGRLFVDAKDLAGSIRIVAGSIPNHPDNNVTRRALEYVADAIEELE